MQSNFKTTIKEFERFMEFIEVEKPILSERQEDSL